MKAIVLDTFGGPEVLHEADSDVPQSGPGQIRVSVRAAGVNPLDGKIRSGVLQRVFPTPLPSTPGTEFAGIVDALGEGVRHVSVGDPVTGWSDTGSYAEYALSTTYAVMPEGLSFNHAAALPVAGETARRVLRLLKLLPGETLLISGGAGAVGTIAVQLALTEGVRVIATAGQDNLPYLAALGAIPTPYGEGLVERVRALAPDGVDAVFDVAGKGALPDAITLCGNATDRIVTIADFAAQALGVAFSSGTPEDRSSADLADLAHLAATGKIATTVARTFPLARAADAHHVSDAGHARGKIVLTV